MRCFAFFALELQFTRSIKCWHSFHCISFRNRSHDLPQMNSDQAAPREHAAVKEVQLMAFGSSRRDLMSFKKANKRTPLPFFCKNNGILHQIQSDCPLLATATSVNTSNTNAAGVVVVNSCDDVSNAKNIFRSH